MAHKPKAKRPEGSSLEKKTATFSQTYRAEKKQAFLDNFKDYGTIYHTGLFIGVPLTTIITWLNNDAAFAEAFKAIRTIPGYMIERAAIERAKDSKNQADTMRIFMLKNLLPDTYAEADKIQLEITVKDILVSQFVSIIQQKVPTTCPHCKTHLSMQDDVAAELLALSERMMKTGGGIVPNHPGA